MHESYENSRPVVNLVRRDMPLREPFFEAPARRGRLFALTLVGILLSLGLYLFLHGSQFFNRFEAKLNVVNGDAAKIQVYNEQLESLQKRMTGFIADSVETKLRTLEKNVAAGNVGTPEIRAFEELKSELRLLETYAAGRGGNLTDPARLDHPRFQASPGSQQALPNGDLLQEVLQLKNLFYVSIASCGLVAVLIGGYWRQNYLQARRLEDRLSRVALLEKKPSDEAL